MESVEFTGGSFFVVVFDAWTVAGVGGDDGGRSGVLVEVVAEIEVTWENIRGILGLKVLLFVLVLVLVDEGFAASVRGLMVTRVEEGAAAGAVGAVGAVEVILLRLFLSTSD
jgi:hypothetical protein